LNLPTIRNADQIVVLHGSGVAEQAGNAKIDLAPTKILM